jgi:PBP1b-binding outer membrane lipoprotein LpoB
MKKLFNILIILFLSGCVSYAGEIKNIPNITTDLKVVSNEQVQLIGENGIRIILTDSKICTVTVDLPKVVSKERVFNTIRKQIRKCYKNISSSKSRIYREKKFFDIIY